jgi:hypothetical protein
MAELGPDAPGYHREAGAHARAAGVDLLVGVGEPARDYDPDELVGAPEEAAELLAAQVERGDAVLVKGSRSAGLEAVAETLSAILAEEGKGFPEGDGKEIMEGKGGPGRGAGGESISDSSSPPASRGGPA